MLLSDPSRLLPLFDEAIKEAATQIYETHWDKGNMTWKPHIHARLSNLPICPELTRTLLPRSGDVGKFLSITGTVSANPPRTWHTRMSFSRAWRAPINVNFSRA